MPRKKSAAKRAKEATKKATTDEIVNSTSNKAVPEPKNELTINEKVDDDSEESSSSSSEEDDYGELVTEEVEEGIKNVLQAIKRNDKEKLLNPNVRFFEDPEKAVEKMERSETEKPIYLKDYHRMNILSGKALEDDEDSELSEMQTVDGKQSYASQQKEEKARLLDEIEGAFDADEDEDEEGFLTKKEPTEREHRTAPLPDPRVNDEKFLEEFIDQQAWIPKKGDKMIDLDRTDQMEEDDEEFDAAVEKFEHAYNFRYEDPSAAEIVSYARNQATLRRSATSSRRRKRDEEKKEVEQTKQEKELQVQKKKKEKVNKLTDVLNQVKKEYGADINESLVKKLSDTLLNGDFEDGQWDNVLGEIFNDQFYEQEGKPTWDENDEIMGDFYQGQSKDAESNQEKAEEDEEEENGEEPPKKKSKKEKINEKKSKKSEKRHISELAEKVVEENKLAIIEEVEEERKSRARTKEEQDIKFRYREVSPESFGLSTREIFAADDTDLNEFIGLKKFAPYRPKELRAKDKRKVMKSRRVRDWKKKVFKNENGLIDQGGDESTAALKDGAHLEKSDKEHKKKRKHKSKD